jgi:hypothetical protein
MPEAKFAVQAGNRAMIAGDYCGGMSMRLINGKKA